MYVETKKGIVAEMSRGTSRKLVWIIIAVGIAVIAIKAANADPQRGYRGWNDGRGHHDFDRDHRGPSFSVRVITPGFQLGWNNGCGFMPAPPPPPCWGSGVFLPTPPPQFYGGCPANGVYAEAYAERAQQLQREQQEAWLEAVREQARRDAERAYGP